MQTDLTKINQPFGDLDRETQWALKGAFADGVEIEFYHRGTCLWTAADPQWSKSGMYRLKPKPVIEVKTYRMGLAAYRCGFPIISEGHKGNPDWSKVDITVEWTDGKVTAVSAELAQ